jgi:general secretion pathway protein G
VFPASRLGTSEVELFRMFAQANEPTRVHRLTAPRRCGAFTLVEILIVVVILGILAAIVIPQFTQATNDSQQTATYDDLKKLRRHVEVYKARNKGNLPAIAAGVGTWGEIVGAGGEYLGSAPLNQWVGGQHSQLITIGTGPDSSYHTNYGWIFDPATGHIWAASFDADDKPLPRP